MGLSSIFQFLLFILLLVSISKVEAQKRVFDVIKYGAFGDAKTDNTEAFSAAWSQACEAEGRNMVLVPQGIFVLRPVDFKGPCKGPIEFRVLGVIRAPTDEQSSLGVHHWISFQYIDGLVLHGGGSFDGQGPSAWHYNDCGKNQHCKQLPISLIFDFVTNARINHIKLIDSKNFHVSIFKCNQMIFNGIKITTPEDSPNTDGIHVASSSNIDIHDSIIAVGDDCISIGQGSQTINITNVMCGPGHGISIGSIGKFPNEEKVEGVSIRNCTFIGTDNGVRIKTWSPSNPGLVSNVMFQHLKMVYVKNPIIIDQNYCPWSSCTQQESYSKVQIRDIKYINIWGTSTSKVAVNMICSKKLPCEEIELGNISLVYNGEGGATSFCSNVRGQAYGIQSPPSCI